MRGGQPGASMVWSYGDGGGGKEEGRKDRAREGRGKACINEP